MNSRTVSIIILYCLDLLLKRKIERHENETGTERTHGHAPEEQKEKDRDQ